MRRQRQYLRSVKIVYGDQSGALGSGPILPFTLKSVASLGLRVAFTIKRNNRAQADTCTLDIYNMPPKFRDAMKEDVEDQWNQRAEVQKKNLDDRERARDLKRLADAFRVNIFAGYGTDADALTLVFRGDLMNVIPEVRRGAIEPITRIELGDTLLALRDSYMQQTFQAGSTFANIMRGSLEALGLSADEGAQNFIRIVGPNAVISKVADGWMGVGRPADKIDEVVDQFGLQWWIRDGEIFFVPQGATIQDFTIRLVEGVNLLDMREKKQYGDIRARALLDPNIVPGRGIVIEDVQGRRIEKGGYRVDAITARGDTHGSNWWVDFEGSTVDSRFLAPTIEFQSSDFTTSALLTELERTATG